MAKITITLNSNSGEMSVSSDSAKVTSLIDGKLEVLEEANVQYPENALGFYLLSKTDSSSPYVERQTIVAEISDDEINFSFMLAEAVSAMLECL